ncbi:MAG TPA: hypothetical protein VEW03_07345 [Longimicrobiaceae bacterium]|nr:hypothetical protein [Longimicrobiaceae bacterium]
MTTHLTETQLNDCADGVPVDSAAAAHLRDCDECRAAVARIRTLTAGLAALPRLGEPGRDLWPEVAALTVDERPGVIRLPAASLRRPAAVPHGWWRAAAAVLLFAAGAGVGRATGGAPADPAPPAVPTYAAGPRDAAARVQRAGTEYVAAVASFAALGGTASEMELAQGRDAALAAMYGAAKELTRLSTADSSASQIYRTVSSTRQLSAAETPGVRF